MKRNGRNVLIFYFTFALVGFFLKLAGPFLWEINFLRSLQGMREGLWFSIFRLVTLFFNPIPLTVTVLVLAYILYTKREEEAIFRLSMPLLLIVATNFIMKMLVQRTRPLDFFLMSVGGYSYPSGHASASMTLGLILYRKTGNRLSLLLPILVGFSRLVLGVHWPSDVVMGFILAIGQYNFLLRGEGRCHE